MKILITADPFIPVPPKHYGGIERIIDMIITEYIELGHEVTLIAHKDSSPATGCVLISYDTDKDDFFKNSWLIFKTYLHFKPDVVHSFSRLAYLIPILPLKVKKLMSYQREPTLVQIRKALVLSYRKSLIFTGCSNYISNQISSYAESNTVYNGVSLNQFEFIENVNFDAPLVFLGRIEEIKGPHIAIEVAIKTNKKLIIAGNIPVEHQNFFDEKIKPFLNQNIHFIGPVNDIQKNKLLKNASAFLMPILWNEPFGIVMAEAMACGTPVIGFGRGAVNEVIEDGVTGYICNDINDMIVAINKLPNISRKDVRNAVERNFSSNVIALEYLKLYNLST